jgi:hypothetical protein
MGLYNQPSNQSSIYINNDSATFLEGAYISLKDPNVKYAGDKAYDQDEQERQNEQEMNRVSDYRHRLNNLRNHIRIPNKTY